MLALIGDGALTGGLAYEGLNNAGASGEPLIVILNDNGMSIDPNVGAMPRHLSHLRSKPAYYHFKKWYRSLFGKHPMENALYRFNHRVKTALKKTLWPGSTLFEDMGFTYLGPIDGHDLPRHPMENALYRFNHRVKTALKKTLWPGSTLFEDMGFTYLGPIDGHDLPRLCDMLGWARELQGPVVVHVHTVKGKGYSFAEQDPGKFHGVAPFDPETGLLRRPAGENFSAQMGKTLISCAARDPRVCAITAAMAEGTGLTEFAREFPERFFDVGIAEGHGVSMAAGLAAQGMIPVFAVYSTFLQRGYDQLIHDVALEKLHVVLAVDRAGLVGADGETHHGCFDALYLSEIPGFTVLCPANFAELRTMMRQALFEYTGPVAVRYPRGGEGAFREDRSQETLVRLREGGDMALLSYGVLVNQLLEAAEILAEEGIQAEVWKLNRIAPLEADALAAGLGDGKPLLVLEDSFGAGCVGQRAAALLAESGHSPRRLYLKNLGRTFAPEGSVAELDHSFGLDAAGVAASARELMCDGQ